MLPLHLPSDRLPADRLLPVRAAAVCAPSPHLATDADGGAVGHGAAAWRQAAAQPREAQCNDAVLAEAVDLAEHLPSLLFCSADDGPYLGLELKPALARIAAALAIAGMPPTRTVPALETAAARALTTLVDLFPQMRLSLGRGTVAALLPVLVDSERRSVRDRAAALCALARACDAAATPLLERAAVGVAASLTRSMHAYALF